jgi:NDP-sugar pyrophosphorylase family protein
VINLHHLPQSIKRVIEGHSPAGLTVSFSEETEILGTSGGLKHAEHHFRDAGTFLLINGDFIIDCDLAPLIRDHSRSGALATMVLVSARSGAGYGAVELGQPDRNGGAIYRISGRPASRRGLDGESYIFTGLHILQPEILDHIRPAASSGINRDVYPPLLEAGRPIRGAIHRGMWREFGTPRLLLNGSLALLEEGTDPGLTLLQTAPGIYLDRIDAPDRVALKPPVLLGPESVIGRRSTLEEGVIVGHRGVIGEGCHLRSSILLEGARVGSGVRLSQCIVDTDAVVPDDSDLHGKVIVSERAGGNGDTRYARLGNSLMAEL